jgi:hypothetical protein
MSKSVRTDMPKNFDFGALVAAIREVDAHLSAQAGKAVNISLTLRNWLVGCYIREYEQNGLDRAQYGETLLGMLSQRLTEAGLDGMAARSLRLYRQFYLIYPEIWQSVSAKSALGLLPGAIWQSMPVISKVEAAPGIVRTVSAKLQVPADRRINSLSFSHSETYMVCDIEMSDEMSVRE